MKMLNIRHKLHSALSRVGLAVLAAVCLSACDSMIYDDEGDCSVHYRVSFRYIKNILQADAFGPQVSDVSLYVFDKSGNLVISKTETRALTTENNFYMDIDLLPGKYDMIAWCGGQSLNPEATRFEVDNADSPTTIRELGATLPLSGSAPGLYSDLDINRLYHGIAYDVECKDVDYGHIDLPVIYLTKDTNHLSVLMQNIDGYPLDKDLFSFTIEAANSRLTYMNDVVGSPEFVYRPWSVETSFASFDQNEPGARATMEDTEIPSGVLAEFTTGRLMADREQYLTVRRTDNGDVILRIPLVNYLLKVKGKYQAIKGDQNYLDCYDDYTLMFFVGEGMTWVKTRVFINGWRIVPSQDTEL